MHPARFSCDIRLNILLEVATLDERHYSRCNIRLRLLLDVATRDVAQLWM